MNSGMNLHFCLGKPICAAQPDSPKTKQHKPNITRQDKTKQTHTHNHLFALTQTPECKDQLRYQPKNSSTAGP